MAVIVIVTSFCLFCCIVLVFFFKYENDVKTENLDSKRWRRKTNEQMRYAGNDESDFYDSGPETESLPITFNVEGGGRLSKESMHKMKSTDNADVRKMIKEHEDATERLNSERNKKKHRKNRSDELFRQHLNDFTMKQQQIFEEQVLQKISNDEDPVLSTDCESNDNEEQSMKPTRRSIFDSIRFRSKSKSQTKSNRSSFSKEKTPKFKSVPSVSNNWA